MASVEERLENVINRVTGFGTQLDKVQGEVVNAFSGVETELAAVKDQLANGTASPATLERLEMAVTNMGEKVQKLDDLNTDAVKDPEAPAEGESPSEPQPAPVDENGGESLPSDGFGN